MSNITRIAKEYMKLGLGSKDIKREMDFRTIPEPELRYAGISLDDPNAAFNDIPDKMLCSLLLEMEILESEKQKSQNAESYESEMFMVER